MGMGQIAALVHIAAKARVDQHLPQNLHGTAAQPMRNRRRQIAAGTVAADRQACRIDAQGARLRRHPSGDGQAVVHRAWEGGLGAHPVIDRDHGAAAAIAQLAAQHVVRVEVADDEPAAVEIDQTRQHGIGGSAGGPVAAAGDGAARAGHRQVAHLAHRRFGRLGEEAAFAVGGTRFLRTHLMDRGQAAFVDQLQQGLGLHIEHGVPTPGNGRETGG